MAICTIKGFIVYRTANYWNDDERFKFSMYDPRAVEGKDDREVFVCEHTAEVEVPDDFDPRAGQIAALEQQKQEIRAKFAAAVTEIDARINKLQALEMA